MWSLRPKPDPSTRPWGMPSACVVVFTALLVLPNPGSPGTCPSFAATLTRRERPERVRAHRFAHGAPGPPADAGGAGTRRRRPLPSGSTGPRAVSAAGPVGSLLGGLGLV